MSPEAVTPERAAQDIEICRLPRLLEHLVMVDGPARAGKTTVSRLISSFERVELERVQEIFDNIGYMTCLGKMDRDAAVSMLRAAADMDIYNLYLSRNVNCRPGDQTGILKSTRPLRYIRRLFSNDGEAAVQRIQSEKPILLQHVHYQLERIGIHFDAFTDSLRVVEMLRHPVDLVAASRSRFAENLCDSKRGAYLCIRHGETSVPVYAKGWEDEYLSANATDRVIRITHSYLVRSLEAYRALPAEQRDQVKFVKFDSVLSDPSGTAEHLAAFLGTRTTRKTRSLTQALSARGQESSRARDDNFVEVREACSADNLARLEELIAIYDDLDGETR